MKIAYIGDFKLPYSTENYVVHALRENGCIVDTYPEQIIKREHIDVICDTQPDVLLLSKARIRGDRDWIINQFKRRNIQVVSWLFDIYVGFGDREFSVKMHHGPWAADVVFSTDGGNEQWFKDNRIYHKTLRQGIHGPEAVIEKREIKNEIVFVGNTTSYQGRADFIERVKERYGESFKIFGDGSEVRGLDLNKLYQESKIVIGDSFPSPKYWSNRVYETIGRGGFLVHPAVDGLEKELEYYKHFVPFTYGNMDELFEIIDYYLSHDDEREAIRNAGFEYVKENLTYTKRCQTLLQEITGMNEPKA